jgi:hypothetical protein
MANVGQSRGSQRHKGFIQDSANSYIVDAFQDMSETASVSPIDGEGYIVENVGSIDASWGTITGLANNDIIRWRQSKLEWQIAMKAVVANQGFKAFVKEEDTLYVVDGGAEWIVASGSGGGVKNFAQKISAAYKPGDWIKGNSGVFGASGTLAGTFSIETAAPLDGKKSFRYDTAAGSGNDWFYILVDIDLYARGKALGFVIDYTWDGDEDLNVKIFDPTFTNEYSTELNVLKNTENDNQKSRNSRTIYAHPNTESQVVVGFQVASTESTGKTLIFDNLAVTDDIGVIGSGYEERRVHEIGLFKSATIANTLAADGTTRFSVTRYDTDNGLLVLTTPNIDDATEGAKWTVSKKCTVSFLIHFEGAGTHWYTELRLIKNGVNTQIGGEFWHENSTGGYDVSATVEMNIGDIIWMDVTLPNWPSSSQELTLHAIESEPEPTARFLQVPNGEKLRDVFSAQGSSTTLNSSNYGWIDSLNTSGNTLQINVKPGIFTETPVAIADINVATPYTQKARAISSTLIEIYCYDNDVQNTTLPVGNWAVIVQKQEQVPDIIGVPVSIQGQTHEADTAIEAISFAGYTSFGGAPQAHTYNNTLVNRGSAATFTNNTYFQINESGLFHVSANCSHVSDVNWSIRKNDTLQVNQLATAAGTTATTGKSASATRWLNAGDTVFVTSGNPVASSNDGNWTFTIAKVGTQPLLDGGLVERPGSNFRVSGIVGTGYCAGTNVIRFDSSNTIESSGVANGDIGFVDSTSDSYVEILEDGFYALGSGNEMVSGVNQGEVTYLTVNATSLTTSPTNLPIGNVLSSSDYIGTSTTGNPDHITNWSGRLNKGDKIRVMISSVNKNLTTSLHRNRFFVNKVGQTTKYSSRVYKEDPIAWQKKAYSSSITSDENDISALRFNNLEIGKTYRVMLHTYINGLDSGLQVVTVCLNNGVEVAKTRFYNNNAGGTNFEAGDTGIFVAGATTLTTNIDRNLVNTHSNNIYIILEELPWHSQTSKWS